MMAVSHFCTSIGIYLIKMAKHNTFSSITVAKYFNLILQDIITCSALNDPASEKRAVPWFPADLNYSAEIVFPQVV